MPEFRELFEAYGGDYDTAMRRFMGNEGMYLKCFGMLFQDKNLEKLGKALSSGDLQAAFEAAHTLKGMAGNMGLEPFSEAVCAIMEPQRAKEEYGDYPALYNGILSEHKKVEAFWVQLNGGV